MLTEEHVVFSGHYKTVGEVRDYLKSVHDSGEVTTCPCCDQLVKTYKRALNAPMARILILIYKYFQETPFDEWTDIYEALESGGFAYKDVMEMF